MALSPYKVFIAGEILTAADLNASFSQITSNALQLISPLTGTLDVDGKTIILDADADSNLAAGTDDVLNLTLQSFLAFIFDGNVASPVNGITLEATATGVGPMISAHGETNVDLRLKGKGTGMVRLLTENSLSLDVSEPLATRVLIKPGGATDVGLAIQGAGTGVVRLGDALLAWPDADGAAGEALVTNAAAVLSWGAGLASGDRLAFQQTTPGGSFAKDTGITSDSAVRLVTGAVANDLTGSAFTTIFAASRATGNESAGHTHSGTTGTSSAGAVACIGGAGNNVTPDHTHSFTTGGVSANHTHTTDMKVNYYDFTIGEAV